jgi:predicted ATPase
VDPAALGNVASVRLYCERARSALPAFELVGENSDAVARICRALDGLPLAIELAAARVRVLGPEGTAKRLGDPVAGLEMLTVGGTLGGGLTVMFIGPEVVTDPALSVARAVSV